LSYTLGPKTSRIWITPDIPLPVRAEVYNSQGQLQYKYDLISYTRWLDLVHLLNGSITTSDFVGHFKVQTRRLVWSQENYISFNLYRE